MRRRVCGRSDARCAGASALGAEGDLIHKSDHRSEYLSFRYSERLIAAGIEASVGLVGDAYVNALAETINGLFTTEVICRRDPWKGLDEVESATFEWVHWFDDVRLFMPIGYVSPLGYEEAYYDGQQGLAVGV